MPFATVIGGHGFIGRALVNHLQASGWECTVPSHHLSEPEARCVQGHVFYCAGLTGDYIARPADTIEAHICLLTKILKAACIDSLVYLSSTRLYDSLAAGGVATEDVRFSISPLLPRHLYDLSKLTGEAVCHALGDGRARVARLSCVYNDYTDSDGFLPSVLRQIAGAPRGSDVNVKSSSWSARDYVHLSDVVRGVVDIAINGVHPVYNVASGYNLRNDYLAECVKINSERSIRFESDQKVPEPVVVDISRMLDEFGWSPIGVVDKITPWLKTLP